MTNCMKDALLARTTQWRDLPRFVDFDPLQQTLLPLGKRLPKSAADRVRIRTAAAEPRAHEADHGDDARRIGQVGCAAV